MNPFLFFGRRVRGFRIIDLLALAVLLTLAFGVYAFKIFAGRESSDADAVQVRIVQEQRRIRLIDAEIAHLEDPGRIERLSRQYLGFKPVDVRRETTAEALPQIAVGGVKP